jgi:aromatic ring-cleaving dioxygenase
MDLNHPDCHSDCELDVPRQIIEYDPQDLPFALENCIDTILPRVDKYKEKLAKFEGKESRSIKILRKDRERGQAIKDMVNAEPPSQTYIENIPYINFNEGSLAFMWDKKRGEPKYDERNEVLWFGPYIVKKRSKKGKYYLSAMDGRKMPLLVDGSLLRPYIQRT